MDADYAEDVMPTSAPERPTVVRIDALQVLRAAAALLVVVGHSQTAAAGLAAARHEAFARTTILPWGAGVDLFFVISGFIMVYASQRLFSRAGGWREFLRRRITRVAPLYWACTSLYIAILLAAHLKGDPRTVEATEAAASYAFFPFAGEGGIFPVFDLGWTLNYEMFFYALFALAIGLHRSAAVLAVVAGLAGLVVVGAVLQPSAAALRFWTQPIILDFAMGAVVGGLRCGGVRWRAGVRWVAFFVGAAVFVVDPLGLFSGAAAGVTVANGFPRVLASGLPAAAVLAAAVLGPDLTWRPLAPLVVLGNASYSLYLTHPFVLILVEKLATRTHLTQRVDYGVVVTGTVAAALVVSLASFRLVEEPLTRLGLRLTKRWALAGAGPITAPSATPKGSPP